jgi:hypothetical protein
MSRFQPVVIDSQRMLGIDVIGKINFIDAIAIEIKREDRTEPHTRHDPSAPNHGETPVK